ncbi:DNA polymerase V [Vibrio sp. UCD-FRSSP16_10]|uniref:DNA recombination protein RmuC n=1 Tax=unclassified Vibrio TaxID=2614977 RepID=UPI00080157E0|nr:MULTISPECIES: DNA recombination protein RmuC [unclassified Vibrio]OBT12136.1 DNA polymerase V [Vibrio sp. UCD-FRSSP16_30]OBT20467.1 DNA polymerase V [Vibrio sp. UCD-FRSSP16_10]
MTLTYVIFGLVILITSVASYWMAHRGASQLRLELELANAELINQTESASQSLQKLQQAQEDIGDLEVRCAQLGSELQSVRVSEHAYRKQVNEKEHALRQMNGELSQAKVAESAAKAHLNAKLEELQTEILRGQSLNSDLRQLNEKYSIAMGKIGELNTEIDTKQTHFEQQLTLLKESKQELSKEFERLANEILERKGQAFKQLNTESMSSILNPIHQELRGFKSKVEDIHSKESEQRVQLRTELQNLQKLNREITDQADKLTTALKGEKKVQGNWGELMLENVLDNSGLRLGIDYKREVSIESEEGRFRPDAIVYLPQKKHLVIDAKTSLNAYTRYVNAEDAVERERALREHTHAVSDRINELAAKEYSKLPGLNSPEVVVMFIPIESAYVEALKADSNLFQSALEKNILVATPTTLLTSLNIVKQLWRFEEQNKHTAELANRAEKFYSKLNTFLLSMEGVGKQLDKAKETYDRALGQLHTGKGNLIKQASEFKELGVAVTRELPAELVEKANLELEYHPSSATLTVIDSPTNN